MAALDLDRGQVREAAQAFTWRAAAQLFLDNVVSALEEERALPVIEGRDVEAVRLRAH